MRRGEISSQEAPPRIRKRRLQHDTPANADSVATYDVAVVGTGPAGSTAARLLAEGGARVALIDKATCHATRPAAAGCSVGRIGGCPRTLAARSSGSFTPIALNFLSDGPALSRNATSAARSLMTMRPELDHQLALAARDAGAELVESCPIRRIAENTDGVTLESDTRRFHARFVIGADGIHSMVQRLAAGPTCRTSPPRWSGRSRWLQRTLPASGMTRGFDFDVIESGYAWSFPSTTTSPSASSASHHATAICKSVSRSTWLGSRSVKS